jgi:hypothetical protein
LDTYTQTYLISQISAQQDFNHQNKNKFLIYIFFLISYPADGDLNSFMQTSRVQRAHSLMSNSSRVAPVYPPSELPANYETRSEISFNRAPLRSLSPDDIQKMKYKIDLG